MGEKQHEAMIDPLWHLADSLTIREAAALIAGYDPSEIKRGIRYSNFDERYPQYLITESVLNNAITGGTLSADVELVSFNDDEVDALYEAKGRIPEIICEDSTRIKLKDLKDWLKKRGFTTGFFFPDTGPLPNFLDSEYKHYASKLAAAVHAWEEVDSNPKLTATRSVKQALDKWLRENAVKFGLTHEDGKLNEQGIKEISKVANWDEKGGATKTPEG